MEYVRHLINHIDWSNRFNRLKEEMIIFVDPGKGSKFNRNWWLIYFNLMGGESNNGSCL